VDRGTVRLQVDVERQRLPVGQRHLDRLVPVAIQAFADAGVAAPAGTARNSAAAATTTARKGRLILFILLPVQSG